MKTILDQYVLQMEQMQNGIDLQGQFNTSMQQEMVGIKNKCQFLKRSYGSLERSVQLMVKNQKWNYSASNIPDNHWIGYGFDGNYIGAMNAFLPQLRKETCTLRIGGHPGDISLGIRESETVILYDNLLLPYWRECQMILTIYPYPTSN